MPRESMQRGSVELHHGRWYLRYNAKTLSGKWRTRRISLPGCLTEREARRQADKLMTAGLATAQPEATFREFAETLWPSYLEQTGARDSTRCQWDYLLQKHLLGFFGPMRLREISKPILSRFFDNLRSNSSPTTGLNCYTLLRLMFGVAMDYDLIPALPISPRLHRPKRERKEKPIFTPEQVRQIISHPTEVADRILLTLGAATGVRIGELVAFKWRDLDVEARVLHVTRRIWRGREGELKTRSSRRALAIDPAIITLLQEYRRLTYFPEPDDLIFPNRLGKPRCQVDLRRKVLYPALEAAGIAREPYRHGFHSFRHTLGTVAYAVTRDPRLVQLLLGHANITTTMGTYVHSQPFSESAGQIGAALVGTDNEFMPHL